MTVPESGQYEWHVGPSSRPLESGESYKMTCKRPDGEVFEDRIVVDRGESKTKNWSANDACGDETGNPPPPPAEVGTCQGKDVTLAGTRGRDVLRGTKGADVIAGRSGKDKIRAKGGDDTVCSGGGKDKVRGNGGDDVAAGGEDGDKLRGGAGSDRLLGGPDADRLDGGPDRDVCLSGKSNRDRLKRCEAGER
jgi:Ca2+-binding RTX toxin-like protein